MDMHINAFGFDPTNCPYDISEMQSVRKWHGYKIGEEVLFLNTDQLPRMHTNFPWTKGSIVGIGLNVRRKPKGSRVVLFAIEVAEDEETVLYHKTHEHLCPIVE